MAKRNVSVNHRYPTLSEFVLGLGFICTIILIFVQQDRIADDKFLMAELESKLSSIPVSVIASDRPPLFLRAP